MGSLLKNIDFANIINLLNKHLENLSSSSRISNEEKFLEKQYDILLNETINDTQINREEHLIQVTIKLLDIQSKMIDNILNRRENIKTDLMEHDYTASLGETYYQEFEEKQNGLYFG
jgi:hypothetical protein